MPIGPDGILVNEAGERLSFTLSSGYESLKDVMTILKEEAAKAGLEYRIEVLDGTASWKKTQEKQHDITFVAFNVSPEMYPRYWETYHSVNAYDKPWLADGRPSPARKLKPQTNNLQSIANAELDARIEDPSTRAAATALGPVKLEPECHAFDACRIPMKTA